MFNLIVARRNCIKTHSFLSCFIHQKSIEKDSSSTLSYLINTCGISHQSAISASEKFIIKATHNPDAVVETLKSYDFTDAQISKLLAKFPKLLSYNMEDIIKPKLDFYLSLGYPRAELGKFIATNPGTLTASLEKRVKPNVELLRSILKSDQLIIDAVTRSSYLLQSNIHSTYLPNIKTLKLYGVGHENILRLISINPRVLMLKSKKFPQIVQFVKECGFNTPNLMFVKAISVFSGLSPLSWEKKVKVFESFGLSRKDVYTIFVKRPMCMSLSEEKIRRGVDFFAKEMKWDPSFVAARAGLLLYSLEKRVIPRCSVMRALASKGFVKHYPSLNYQFLLVSETKFMENYVTKYKEQVPQVMDMYNIKLK